MDFHKGLSASVEEVKKAHIADETVQSKYGVIYHQFWINEEEGTVFCLMEGPDKESCAAVHREAHGGLACSIVEVNPGWYKLFMGDGHIIEQGHVKHRDGTTDRGIRNILVINVQDLASPDVNGSRPLKIPHETKELILSIVSAYGGREVNWLHDNSLITVFDSSANGLECSLQIQKDSEDKKNRALCRPDIVLRMALSAGQPVTEQGDFFSEATTLARRMCSVAHANELLVSTKVDELCNIQDQAGNASSRRLRILTARDEDFITRLYTISEQNLSDENFTVDSLSRDIGISRPQLYRKMISLFGKSPNDFLRDLRMNKALSLIKKKAGNISEIALEVGYNNPSYFAKCFQVRYGCSPSRFVE
jgi:AraC-like DNA-binding protein